MAKKLHKVLTVKNTSKAAKAQGCFEGNDEVAQFHVELRS
jgi:hypothetical protein